MKLQVGDGWKGWPELAPFDAIHVGAAAATMPQALLEQLKPGGGQKKAIKTKYARPLILVNIVRFYIINSGIRVQRLRLNV